MSFFVAVFFFMRWPIDVFYIRKLFFIFELQNIAKWTTTTLKEENDHQTVNVSEKKGISTQSILLQM